MRVSSVSITELRKKHHNVEVTYFPDKPGGLIQSCDYFSETFSSHSGALGKKCKNKTAENLAKKKRCSPLSCKVLLVGDLE